MVQRVITKRKIDSGNTSKLIQTILEEIRLLRQEIVFLIPREDLQEYAHPTRILNSYRRAIKKYPPIYEKNA